MQGAPDELGVALVDRGHPRGRDLGRLPEGDVARDEPLDTDALLQGVSVGAAPGQVLTGESLDRFVGDAMVLTDDHAPVDQLLTTTPR